MKKFILVIGMVMFATAASADRGWHNDDRGYRNQDFWSRVAQRMDRQWHRIERGKRHGDLTRWEAKKLHRQQRRVAKRIDRIRSKHQVRGHDRRRVMAQLDRASDNIHRLKNNQYFQQRAPRYSGAYDRRAGGQVAWNDGRSAGFYFRY